MNKVYLGLGGNLGDPYRTIQKAFELICQLPQVENCQLSQLYCTSPVGNEAQPDYINAVCSLETTLEPQMLYRLTRSIEITLGKVSKLKNDPRLIDIDILLFGNQIYHDDELMIPHPRWTERLFVLVPLQEFVSELVVEDVVFKLEDLIEALKKNTNQKIEEYSLI